MLFPEGYTFGDRYPISFNCPCSRQRFEGAIVSLGSDEIQRIIDEEDQPYTEVVCHFCNEAYHFAPHEMQGILDRSRD
jgi:molecular chaperone Hsp33